MSSSTPLHSPNLKYDVAQMYKQEIVHASLALFNFYHYANELVGTVNPVVIDV